MVEIAQNRCQGVFEAPDGLPVDAPAAGLQAAGVDNALTGRLDFRTFQGFSVSNEWSHTCMR